jgi:hypothetical protein
MFRRHYQTVDGGRVVLCEGPGERGGEGGSFGAALMGGWVINYYLVLKYDY